MNRLQSGISSPVDVYMYLDDNEGGGHHGNEQVEQDDDGRDVVNPIQRVAHGLRKLVLVD